LAWIRGGIMSMERAGRLLSALLLLSCLCLFQPRTAAAQSEKPLTLRTEVELVAVEVSALDKNGKPVKNLKKENFQLFEDGKQQEIASFDEVTEAQGGPSSLGMNLLDDNARRGGKTVLILFDDGALSAENVKRSRDSAALFVKEHMKSEDWFAVASFGYDLKFLENLTNDPEKIMKAIAQPAISLANSSPTTDDGSTASLPSLGKPRDQDPAMQSSNYQSEGLLSALQAINYAIERIKGQKSVLIYSQSNYINPKTIEKVYKAALTSAKRSNVVYYTVDPGGLTAMQPSQWGSNADTGTTTASSLSSTSSDPNSSSSTTTAAAARPSSSTSSSSASSAAASASLSQTSTANTENAVLPNIANQSGGGGLSLLKALASETGGSSIFNTNNYNLELARLDSQLSNYYILGFNSNNPKRNGELRKLDVKIDQKGIVLKHRNAYLDRRPVDMLASSKREGKLLDALASPATATQLPLSFRPAYFYDSSRLSRVLIFAEIGLEKAAIAKKGDQLECNLSIMGVAYAEDGSIAGRFSETLNQKFDKDKEQDARKMHLPYHNYFKLLPGKYRLKLAVSDESNNLGATEQSFEAPAKPQQGLAVSSLVVIAQKTALPNLVQNIQAQLLDDSDPLIYNGMQIAPSVNNKLPAHSSIPVLFKIYNISSSSSQPKLQAEARLVDENGEEFGNSLIDLNETQLAITGKSEAVAGFALTFPDAKPGKYKLIIETSEVGFPDIATAQTDLNLTGN
jgi:VWFA-related protein